MVENVARTDPPRAPAIGRPPWLALSAYHILIPVGGLLVVLGALRSSLGWAFVGAGLMVAGIALQLRVLRASAQVIRAAAARPHEVARPEVATSDAGASGFPPGFCFGCGWKGERRAVWCPRCGRSTVVVVR